MNLFKQTIISVTTTLVSSIAYVPLAITIYHYKLNGYFSLISWALSMLFIVVYSLLLFKIFKIQNY